MWVQFLGWEDPLRKEMGTMPVFLPGKSHVQRSLVGYSPWGGKELDTTERLSMIPVFKHKFSQLLAVIICFFKYVHAFRAASY